MCTGALFWAGARKVTFTLSQSKLNDLTNTRRGKGFGLAVDAAHIGRTATPPMEIVGPIREIDAALPHAGFWETLDESADWPLD